MLSLHQLSQGKPLNQWAVLQASLLGFVAGSTPMGSAALSAALASASGFVLGTVFSLLHLHPEDLQIKTAITEEVRKAGPRYSSSYLPFSNV